MRNFEHGVFSLIVNCVPNWPVFEGKSGMEVSKRTHSEVVMWRVGCDSQHLESQVYPVSTRPPSPRPCGYPIITLHPALSRQTWYNAC